MFSVLDLDCLDMLRFIHYLPLRLWVMMTRQDRDHGNFW
jgi:hypothetical protein